MEKKSVVNIYSSQILNAHNSPKWHRLIRYQTVISTAGHVMKNESHQNHRCVLNRFELCRNFALIKLISFTKMFMKICSKDFSIIILILLKMFSSVYFSDLFSSMISQSERSFIYFRSIDVLVFLKKKCVKVLIRNRRKIFYFREITILRNAKNKNSHSKERTRSTKSKIRNQ